MIRDNEKTNAFLKTSKIYLRKTKIVSKRNLLSLYSERKFIITKRMSRRVKRKVHLDWTNPPEIPFFLFAVRKNAALHPIRKMKRPISHLLALSPFYDASLFSSHTYILWYYYGCLAMAFFFRKIHQFLWWHMRRLDIKLWVELHYLPKRGTKVTRWGKMQFYVQKSHKNKSEVFYLIFLVKSKISTTK